MSATRLVSSQQSSNTNLLTPTTQAVPLRAAPFVKPFSHAYTFGVALYYYLRAGSLVSDPLKTLTQDLVPLAILQALFCAICLPPAGNWHSESTSDQVKSGKLTDTTWTSSKSGKHRDVTGSGSLRKRGGGGGVGGLSVSNSKGSTSASLQNRTMATVFALILTLTVPPVPLTILALVLGAPLYPTSQIPFTGMLAVHVALLAFLPIFYTHGVSAAAWKDVTAAWLPFDEAGVWAGTIGCLVGGWIGAIPIALDWDREWQKWPCTVLWGAVIGWAVGRVITGVLKIGIGSRINFSESDSRDLAIPSPIKSGTITDDAVARKQQ